MGAVPVESGDSNGIPYTGAPAEPAEGTDSFLRLDAFPVQDGGTTVVYGTGTGKTEQYMQFILDSLMAHKGPKRLSDVTDQARRARDLLDRLDDDESANALSALRFAAPGDTVRLGSHDLVIKGPNDFVLIECKSFQGRREAAALEAGDGARRQSAALTADEEAGAHWRALPMYAPRPFTCKACCAATVPASASAAVVSPQAPAPGATAADRWVYMLLYIAVEYPPYFGFRITTQDRRLLRDYHEALRRFVLVFLVRLDRMAVTLRAALSHLAQAPTFLLVMLATTRHYGRGGDSDGHFLPTPVLQGIQRRGAVCLAAQGHAA